MSGVVVVLPVDGVASLDERRVTHGRQMILVKKEAFVKMGGGYAQLKCQVVGTVKMIPQRRLQYWL